MNTRHITPKDTPTGNQLVRLEDVPLQQRLAAARSLARTTGDTEEADTLLHLALFPGTASGRIAA